jgi:hypothetical protein
MALSRRRKQQKEEQQRDPFGHLAGDRQAAESGEPWFLAPDDGPELDIEAGISSNLSDEDLE